MMSASLAVVFWDRKRDAKFHHNSELSGDGGVRTALLDCVGTADYSEEKSSDEFERVHFQDGNSQINDAQKTLADNQEQDFQDARPEDD
jgi:hypothetical protein